VTRFTRTFGAAAVVIWLAIASGCGGSDDGGETPLTKVSFVTGLNIQGRESYIYAAIDKGYFSSAGLEVDVVPGQGTGGNLKLLQSGQADFAVLDITAALIEYAKGQYKDFTVVSAIQQNNLACLMALEGTGVNSPKDLAGKKVGYVPGGVVRTLFDGYAKLAGVDGSTVQWVNIAAQAQPAALAAGQVQAITQFVVGQPQVENVAKGRKAVVLPYSDYLKDLYGNGLGVSRKTAREKPDLVKKFNEAMLEGLQYVIEHPDEAGQIYAKYEKLQPAPVAAREVTLMTPYVQVSGAPIGALSKQRVARNIAILQAAGAIPGPVNPDDVVSFDLAKGG
jgi:NitT/TauT family transport system substrate-binding protein